MRILMLAQFFRPIVGGEERSVEDLATALATRGHDVAVATLRGPGSPPREDVGGVRIHRLDGLLGRLGWLFREAERRHVPPLPDPQLVAALARVVSEERPDVVHAHNWIVHSFVPLRRRTEAPLVLSLHDYSLICATKRLVRAGSVCAGPGAARCLRCSASHYGRVKGPLVAGGLRASASVLGRAVDMYLPVSQAVAERLLLAERGLPFEVIPNLLPDRETSADAPSEQHLVEQLPAGGFILFLGDATYDKGALVLLEAHRLLERSPPLVFVGRPVDIGPAGRNGNVLVLGAWPHRAALEAVRRSTLVVAPSIVPETFGIGVLEAMNSGKPVVASRLGGLTELVADGATGQLVPPGDALALRDAIADLLSEPAALETMGRAAGDRARLYTADRVAPRVEHVYRSLLGTATPQPGAEP